MATRGRAKGDIVTAGLPYFAWIDASETVFGPEHQRWDESVFSFTLKQDEGDPASLTAVVRRPKNSEGNAIGLLGPGRKIWAWFALDTGADLVKFRGRLVGIPTSIFEELVTLEFVARPIDVVAQKAALADSLRVLPYYDDAVIEPSRRTDPDVVLEGYTKIWAYNPETHVVTVSDEITGEDGLVEFDGASEAGKVLYDGLGLTLTSGPLARVDVSAEFNWTQQARGTVDLTEYLTSNWPGAVNGVITSYSLTAADWPKTGATLGDGWVVADATATDFYDFTVYSATSTGTLNVEWPDGGKSTTTSTSTSSHVYAPFGPGIESGDIPQSSVSVTYALDGDKRLYAASYSRNDSGAIAVMPAQAIQPTLIAGYDAKRPYTEKVTFSLFADVQSILTDPEDGEALLINDVRSVDLSEIIGDPRRRSYISTERGNRSLEHLILLARAHLMKRARVVEISFVPKLSRMAEITLRKNVFLIEPRVGEALGKIISYSIALDGADGRINCEVRIGCAIGRGGSAVASGGEPVYCSIDYTGADYQQFTGRTVLFDSSVGYQPPNFVPNDDGINFLSVLRVEDVIERGLVVEYGPEEQQENLQANAFTGGTASSIADQNRAMATRAEYNQNLLKQFETRASFKLKNMTGAFAGDYVLAVTDVKIPTGYNLEAT
jgi:hypothetical protein